MAGSASERIVVTGLGAVSPIGAGVDATWEAALAGRSGIAPISRFDASELPVRFAGEATDEVDLGDLPEKETRRFDRFVRLALAAAREAVRDAALEVEKLDRERIGTAIGSGIGGLDTVTSNLRTLIDRGPRRVSPFTIPMSIGNMASGYVSIVYGLRGPNLAHVSACASGAHAIGEAADWIRSGRVDAMLVGGSEAPIVDIGVAGFAAMRALSTRNEDPEAASRPFDRGRDGFVMGEGAGVLVIESLEHARARGATIRAELLGYGSTSDGLHMAAPDESGAGAARCMELALADAGLSPGDIDHINPHATSTPAGDLAEVSALRSVFGDALDGIPVSATKSLTGHLLGAAGALEAIFAIRALETGRMPATRNLDDPDPDCVLDHVVGAPREAVLATAMSNSFGFGGTNATLVFGAPQ